MTKDNRQPEQTKDGLFRIISAHNGLWQFQRLVDLRSKEDRRGDWGQGSQVQSPWEDVGMPQEYEVAKGLLSEREPPHVVRKKLEG